MTTIQDIYDYLCRLAPPELQMDFDNSGFLVGHGDTEVRKVLLALDITDAVIDEASEAGAQLILSHHPLIFHPLRSLTAGGEGELALRLIERGIAAICMHTNLDIAEGGVNDVLFSLLGGRAEAPLDKDGCGRCGVLDEAIPLPAFLELCKERLHGGGLRYYDAGRPVKRLAVMGGAGGDALRDAVEKGCDTYVTADVKYHQFLEAAHCGINLIDADHFCTENPVIPVLAAKLADAFPEPEFVVSSRHRQIIRFF